MGQVMVSFTIQVTLIKVFTTSDNHFSSITYWISSSVSPNKEKSKLPIISNEISFRSGTEFLVFYQFIAK